MPRLEFIENPKSTWKTWDDAVWDGESFVYLNNLFLQKSLVIPVFKNDLSSEIKDAVLPLYASTFDIINYSGRDVTIHDLGYIRFNDVSGFGVSFWHKEGSSYNSTALYSINFKTSEYDSIVTSGTPSMTYDIWHDNGAVSLFAVISDSEHNVDGYDIYICWPLLYKNDMFSGVYSPGSRILPFGNIDIFPDGANGLSVTDAVMYGVDPYSGGGDSTTGGGGGSFDGTTEIINEPDSPLVNISNTHFVSLYNPTESQIKSLSDYMWNTLAIENWRKIVADPMDAIISLAVLPIDVPSSGTREIYVGAFSTGIACNVASAQYISFDCGTLLIPQYSNSYLDYAPYTDISIYIPYVGLRSLPCDAIMGKTIGLKYRIDIFSGACVVYLTVNGSVLLQFTGNCAQPIPFTSQSWGTAVTNAISMVASGASMIAMPATAPLAIANMASTAVNGGFKADITKGGGSGGNTGFLGVQKPYVIIQRPVQCIPANQNAFTGYPSYITATFGDLKGYTEVDKIILENINATESELNELESILKGGVYVNEL